MELLMMVLLCAILSMVAMANNTSTSGVVSDFNKEKLVHTIKEAIVVTYREGSYARRERIIELLSLLNSYEDTSIFIEDNNEILEYIFDRNSP